LSEVASIILIANTRPPYFSFNSPLQSLEPTFPSLDAIKKEKQQNCHDSTPSTAVEMSLFSWLHIYLLISDVTINIKQPKTRILAYHKFWLLKKQNGNSS